MVRILGLDKSKFREFRSYLFGCFSWYYRFVMASKREWNDETQRKEQNLRLNRALVTVSKSIAANQKEIRRMSAEYKNNGGDFLFEFDSSAWDAVKAEVVPFLKNPELQQQLAFYFLRLQSLDKLNDLNIKFKLGADGAFRDSKKITDQLKESIFRTLDRLDSDSTELAKTLEKLENGSN